MPTGLPTGERTQIAFPLPRAVFISYASHTATTRAAYKILQEKNVTKKPNSTNPHPCSPHESSTQGSYTCCLRRSQGTQGSACSRCSGGILHTAQTWGGIHGPGDNVQQIYTNNPVHCHNPDPHSTLSTCTAHCSTHPHSGQNTPWSLNRTGPDTETFRISKSQLEI